MISSFIYLYHLDKCYNIPSTPETLPNSYQANFSFETIMNRTAPKAIYSGSGPRTLQVSLTLHSQLFELDNSGESVNDLINALIASAYPKFDFENSKIEPPKILLKFGNCCTIRGVINGQVNVTWKGPWLKDGTMAVAEISFSIQELDQYSAEYLLKFGTSPELPSDFTISTTLQRGKYANSL